MKKNIFIILCSFIIFSCGTINHGNYKTDTLDESDIVLLFISPYVQVVKFDSVEVKWESIVFQKQHQISIPAGEHILEVYYFYNGGGMGVASVNSVENTEMKYNFEPGKQYLLYGNREGTFIYYKIKEKIDE